MTWHTSISQLLISVSFPIIYITMHITVHWNKLASEFNTFMILVPYKEGTEL